MSLFINNQQSPGKDRPFNIFPPQPIVLNRAPTVNDRGSDIGQSWIQNKDSNGNLLNLIWIFTNPGVWTPIEAGGGIGNFTSLVVNPGPTTLTGVLTQTGTANINTAGAAVTNIGTGGTGTVNIGNATGNTAVTGTLAVSGNIGSTTGSVAALTLYATGDAGGIALSNSLSNVSENATGAGTVTFAPHAATGNITQTGWLKMYVGTTVAWVPYFTTV
jgi:hypothetical protein